MNQQYLNVDNLNFEYPDGFKALENIDIRRIKLDDLNSRASSSNVPLKPLEIIEL